MCSQRKKWYLFHDLWLDGYDVCLENIFGSFPIAMLEYWKVHTSWDKNIIQYMFFGEVAGSIPISWMKKKQ